MTYHFPDNFRLPDVNRDTNEVSPSWLRTGGLQNSREDTVMYAGLLSLQTGRPATAVLGNNLRVRVDAAPYADAPTEVPTYIPRIVDDVMGRLGGIASPAVTPTPVQNLIPPFNDPATFDAMDRILSAGPADLASDERAQLRGLPSRAEITSHPKVAYTVFMAGRTALDRLGSQN